MFLTRFLTETAGPSQEHKWKIEHRSQQKHLEFERGWHKLSYTVENCLCFRRWLLTEEEQRWTNLRTFAPIATAHFFAHVTHSSCIPSKVWKALDNIDLNLVSHRYVSGVLKNDNFVSACSRAPRFWSIAARIISAIKRSIDLSSLYH